MKNSTVCQQRYLRISTGIPASRRRHVATLNNCNWVHCFHYSIFIPSSQTHICPPDRPLIDVYATPYAELGDELLLELELELELELLSATTSVGIGTAGMGKGVSLLIVGCPRHPDFTIAARSSSPIMKYKGAMMGCAACMWHCSAYVHNHLVHDLIGHVVGSFVPGLHLEPFAALLTCMLYSHAALGMPHSSYLHFATTCQCGMA